MHRNNKNLLLNSSTADDIFAAEFETGEQMWDLEMMLMFLIPFIYHYISFLSLLSYSFLSLSELIFSSIFDLQIILFILGPYSTDGGRDSMTTPSISCLRYGMYEIILAV